MGLLMSFTRWVGLTALGRRSFIYQSLHHSIRLPFSLSVRLSLQLPAGSISVGSSIRLTDWRLMTLTNREEAVLLRDYSPIERRIDRLRHTDVFNVLHAGRNTPGGAFVCKGYTHFCPCVWSRTDSTRWDQRSDQGRAICCRTAVSEHSSSGLWQFVVLLLWWWRWWRKI